MSTDKSGTCRVQVVVDGHMVADLDCCTCDVEIERGGDKVELCPDGAWGPMRTWHRRDHLTLKAIIDKRGARLCEPDWGSDQ